MGHKYICVTTCTFRDRLYKEGEILPSLLPGEKVPRHFKLSGKVPVVPEEVPEDAPKTLYALQKNTEKQEALRKKKMDEVIAKKEESIREAKEKKLAGLAGLSSMSDEFLN